MISNIELMALPDRERACYQVENEFYQKWQPNITVSVWGKGKATLVSKKLCLDTDVTGKQRYAGNCDECDYFMGCQFPKGTDDIRWGDHMPGCCSLILNKQLQSEAPILAD